MSLVNCKYDKFFTFIKFGCIAITLAIFLNSCSNKKAKYSPKKKYDPYKYQGSYKIGKPYTVKAKTYYPKDCHSHEEVGQASWYGARDNFHGRMTANGDVFNKDMLTAAHKTLPLPSMIEVTNLANGKTAILMINDRGPFSSKRILDVSEKSAQILGFKLQGVAKVKIKYLKYETEKLLLKLKLNKKEGSIASQNLHNQKCSVDCYLNNVNSKKYSSLINKPHSAKTDNNELPIPPNINLIFPATSSTALEKILPKAVSNEYYILVKNLKSYNVTYKFLRLHKNLGNKTIVKQKTFYNIKFGPYKDFKQAKKLLDSIKNPYRTNSILVKAK